MKAYNEDGTYNMESNFSSKVKNALWALSPDELSVSNKTYCIMNNVGAKVIFTKDLSFNSNNSVDYFTAQLKERLLLNAKVQAGDQPAEKPESLLAELEEATCQLIALICTINRANAAAQVEGRSLANLLAERDARMAQAAILRAFLAGAAAKVDRYF